MRMRLVSVVSTTAAVAPRSWRILEVVARMTTSNLREGLGRLKVMHPSQRNTLQPGALSHRMIDPHGS